MNTEQAIQLLTDLGENADSVARSLKAHGIRGSHTCFSCPIARFLINNGASYGQCSVGSMIRLSLGDLTEGGRKMPESFNPPTAIKAFIDGFDSGAYPQLEYK